MSQESAQEQLTDQVRSFCHTVQSCLAHKACKHCFASVPPQHGVQITPIPYVDRVTFLTLNLTLE